MSSPSLTLTSADRTSYGAQGMFLNLNDMIDQYTFYWKDSVAAWCTDSEKVNITKMITSPDGGLYSFPFFYSDPTDPQCYSLWINQDWLTKLNLKMPTTTDEFYDVLVAFRDQDPNGNGKADEVPLVGADDWITDPAMCLMNAFEYFTGDYYDHLLNVDDSGKLYASYMTDNYKEGLRYLNKLYTAGLYSDLSFTQKYSGGLRPMCDPTGDQTVGVFCGHPELCFAKDSVNRMSYTDVSPLTGSTGNCYVPWEVPMPYGNTYITKDCDVPQIAVRMLDYFASPETSLSVRYGEEGTDWWLADPAKYQDAKVRFPGLSDSVYYDTPNLVVGTENRQMYGTWSLALIPPKMFASLPAATYEDKALQYREDDFAASVAHRLGKNPKQVCSRLIFTEDENLDIGEIQSTLKSYALESQARFMKGELDIDKDWDAYIADVQGIGVDHFIEVAQQCFDRMNG